jgi:hypothetical protein
MIHVVTNAHMCLFDMCDKYRQIVGSKCTPIFGFLPTEQFVEKLLCARTHVPVCCIRT